MQGGLGRNSLTGFGLAQTDLALRRQFSLGERQTVSLRVEAFNLFNHANLADPVRYLSSPLFGQSASMRSRQLGTGSPGTGLSPMFQIGGPRAVQFVLRWRF